MTPDPRLLIYQNAHFWAEQSHACSVPGYVVVTARQPAGSISEMGVEALALLGPTLSLVTRAIDHVVGPERVYCARFGEATAQVHFHVFPRTRRMAEAFIAAHPGEAFISGPLLFHWAVLQFAWDRASTAEPPELAAAIDGMRRFCREQAS